MFNKLVSYVVEVSKNFDSQVSKNQIEVDTHLSRIVGQFFVVALIIIGIYLCIVATVDVDKYYMYIHEDNIIESASAYSWFAAMLVLLSSLFRYIMQGHKFGITLFLYAGLALFTFLCGGEEISWGQRIFNFDSPEVFKQLNIQNETNLHDIGSISIFSNTFFLITIIYFLVIPRLANKYFPDKQYLRYFLPIPNSQTVWVYIVTLISWIYVGLRFGTLGFHPYSFYEAHYYNQMDDEIFEFMAAYSFLCFSVTDRLKYIKKQ